MTIPQTLHLLSDCFLVGGIWMFMLHIPWVAAYVFCETAKTLNDKWVGYTALGSVIITIGVLIRFWI